MDSIRISSADASSGGALPSPSTGGADSSGIGVGKMSLMPQEEVKSAEIMMGINDRLVFIPEVKFL
jgi:hypothetical protein